MLLNRHKFSYKIRWYLYLRYHIDTTEFIYLHKVAAMKIVFYHELYFSMENSKKRNFYLLVDPGKIYA